MLISYKQNYLYHMIGHLNSLWKFLITYKFIFLLFSLAFQIVVPVFFKRIFVEDLMTYLGISFTVLSSVLIFNTKGRFHVFTVVAILLIMLVFNWMDYFQETHRLIQIPRVLLLIALYGSIFYMIFKEFNRRGKVSLDFIFGAISGYLIIGLIGAFISVVINYYYPMSFSFDEVNSDFQDHIYYNFMTVTTVGYGDISPTTPQGQSHAVMIALIGQLYLTITIAMIVGKYLSNNE